MIGNFKSMQSMHSLAKEWPFGMNQTEYRALQVAAMTNNQGTTPEHTLNCILFSVLCCVLCVVGRSSRFCWYQYIVEYIGIVVAMILAQTVLHEHLDLFTKPIAAILSLMFICNIIEIFSSFNTLNIFHPCNRMQCITNVRGLTYLITVFCILAVDFSVFPRTLGKTERYGYSLMDTGVGLFTIGSGLIHKTYSKSTIGMLIVDNMKLLFLLGFGLIRLFALKVVDYHEHVTEYGVHWNFFYTMFVTKLLGIILLHFVGVGLALPLSIAILTGHQAMLSSGLEKWVFSDAPRDNLLSANREGVVSALGYVALYTYGVYIKEVVTEILVLRRTVVMKLSIISILTFALVFSSDYLGPPSRALANAGYCMYIIWIFTMIILLFYIVQVVLHKRETSSVPCIIDAFNNNGLFLFLLANVLTGIVNLSSQTLLVSAIPSIFLLNLYMIVLCVVSIALDRKGIRL